jgi:hypothetical protein
MTHRMTPCAAPKCATCGNMLISPLGSIACCCEWCLLQDRNYCATINVVLKGYTVSGAPAGFPAQITLPFTVCFYKHNGQATAKFNFGACGAGGGGHSSQQHACICVCLHLPVNSACMPAPGSACACARLRPNCSMCM